ncbi:hypothetical protein ACC754_39315, partial [Rhizobium johnstonii]
KTRQERTLPPLPFGVEFLDGALEGGLPLYAITEFRSALSRDAGAAGKCRSIRQRLQSGRGWFDMKTQGRTACLLRYGLTDKKERTAGSM